MEICCREIVKKEVEPSPIQVALTDLIEATFNNFEEHWPKLKPMTPYEYLTEWNSMTVSLPRRNGTSTAVNLIFDRMKDKVVYLLSDLDDYYFSYRSNIKTFPLNDWKEWLAGQKVPDIVIFDGSVNQKEAARFFRDYETFFVFFSTPGVEYHEPVD